MQDATDSFIGHEAPPDSIQRQSSGPRDLKNLTCGCSNRRQVKRWVDCYLQQHPLERSPQRNAGTLRSLLAEITRWSAPARQRLDSLEVLRPTVAAQCRTLARSQLAQDSKGNIGQTQEQRRNLLTAVILYQHQALAYTSVCLQLAREPRGLFYRRHLARALHRGIDSYRRLIQISSHFYLAPPKGSWARMQRLLQLAREQNLEQRRVVEPLADTDNALSAPNAAGKISGSFSLFRQREKISQPYFHTALFASANPLQLAAEEQQQLWQYCAKWADKAVLVDSFAPRAETLLACLKLDQPPIPIARLQRSHIDMKHFAAPQGWSIELRGPLKQLRHALRHPDKLSAGLLNRVQALWAGEQGRRNKRTPVNVRCQVAVGISAICHHLKQGNGPSPDKAATGAATHSANRSSSLVMEVGSIDYQTGRALKDYEVSISDHANNDAADSHSADYAPSSPPNYLTGDLPTARPVSRANGIGQRRYQTIPGTLLNSSSSGAGLRLPPDAHSRVHSGDLIALRIEQQWELALVRWHYSLPDQCRAGLERLNGQTRAVRVHRHTKNGGRSDPMAGLLYGDAGQPPELVLPTPLFQSGDTVDLVAAGQVETITLCQRNLITGSFAIFEFS